MQACVGFPQCSFDDFKTNAILRWFYEIYMWFQVFSPVFVSFLKLLVAPIVLVGILYVALNLKSDVKFSSLFARASFWLFLTAYGYGKDDE